MSAAPAKTPKPTGTVTFSASPSADAGEEIGPASCALVPHGGAERCVTSFVTATEDNYTISGDYSGDQNYLSASAQTTLTINRGAGDDFASACLR